MSDNLVLYFAIQPLGSSKRSSGASFRKHGNRYAARAPRSAARSRTYFDSVSGRVAQRKVAARRGHGAYFAACFAASLQFLLVLPQSHWPVDLVAYLNGCRDLAMPREPVQLPKEFPWSAAGTAVEPAVIHAEIQRGMSPKKHHEVSILSPILSDLSVAAGFQHWVDVGSGLGYLGNVARFQYNLSWVNCEGNVTHAAKSIVRSDDLEQRLGLPASSAALADCSFAHVFLTHDSSPAVLDETVGEGVPYGICGLHSCGDLSVCLLQIFAHSSARAKSIVNVGCCYHKLLAGDTKRSFPLSAHLKLLHQAEPVSSPHRTCDRTVVASLTQVHSLQLCWSLLRRLWVSGLPSLRRRFKRALISCCFVLFSILFCSITFLTQHNSFSTSKRCAMLFSSPLPRQQCAPVVQNEPYIRAALCQLRANCPRKIMGAISGGANCSSPVYGGPVRYCERPRERAYTRMV